MPNFDKIPDQELSCQLSEPVSDAMAPTCGTLTNRTTPVTINSSLSIAMIDEADEGLEPKFNHTQPYRLSSRLASFYSISQSDFGVESIDEEKNNSEVCRPGTPTSYSGLAFMFSKSGRNAETQDCTREKQVPVMLLGSIERCELPNIGGQNLSQEPYPTVWLDKESKKQCSVPSPNKIINEQRSETSTLKDRNFVMETSKYTSFTQDAIQFAFMSTPFKIARPFDICRDISDSFIRHQTVF
ncbi:hypothetical protein BKA69DRAFT_1127260 [Paraphysoderma sedebokerense]|nr:hypothetical protein BKA69DRAFT_1127260 [Paraphysoderma sedebokerense]